MKRIGKFLAAALFSMFIFGAAHAQDLSQATELYNNAATALQGGDNVTALENFQKALTAAQSVGEEGASMVAEIKGIIPKLLIQMGKEDATNKKTDDALAKLKEAVAKAEEYGQPDVAKDAKELIPNILLMAGNALLNDGKFAEAAAEYQKVITEAPDNGMAYLRLGMAQNQLKDETNAIENLKKAAELGQKDNAYKQLLNLYAKKAVAAYSAKNNASMLENALAASEYGDNPQVSKLGGIAAFNLKKYDQAITLLEKVQDGKDATIAYYLARSYEGKGNNAKACVYYKQIVTNAQFKDFAQSKVTSLQCK